MSITSAFNNIEKLETDLWEAADNLRANSKLTSSDYFMPVLGVIFLRHAANRFDVATRQIEDDKAAGKMHLARGKIRRMAGLADTPQWARPVLAAALRRTRFRKSGRVG